MRKVMYFWDLDRTLIQETSECATYVEDGVTKRIAPNDVESTGLPWERFCWDEFMYATEFCRSAEACTSINAVAELTRHRRFAEHDCDYAIVTARQTPLEPFLFLQKLNSIGIGASFQDIFFSGDLHELYPTHWERKKHAIRDRLHCDEYDEAWFFDDDYRNLDSFLELAPEFPGMRLMTFLANDGVLEKYKEIDPAASIQAESPNDR